MLTSFQNLFSTKTPAQRRRTEAEQQVIAARNKLAELRKTRTTRHVTTQMVSRFFETTQTSLDFENSRGASTHQESI